MKRKDYEKPTTQIVQLQHTGMLMASGTESERQDYGNGGEQEW